MNTNLIDVRDWMLKAAREMRGALNAHELAEVAADQFEMPLEAALLPCMIDSAALAIARASGRVF